VFAEARFFAYIRQVYARTQVKEQPVCLSALSRSHRCGFGLSNYLRPQATRYRDFRTTRRLNNDL